MTQMQQKPIRHHNFILSLWQGNLDSPTGWRYSLENPHTGERKGFNTIEALMRYLKDWIVDTSDATE